jgi:hypothetical protein
VREAHDMNAAVPILVTLLGIMIDVIALLLKQPLPIVSSTEPVSNVTVVREAHNLKAVLPILVIVLGIMIELRSVLLRNVLVSILVQPLPKITLGGLKADV